MRRAHHATIEPMAALRLARDLLGRALDLALPARCVGCDDEGAPLCAACEPALDARLGVPAGVPIGLMSDIPEPLLQLDWCAPFEGTVRRALHDLKYAGEQRLALPLGRAIARRWRRAAAGGDLIVPVPVHAERRRSRGYDQAELIGLVAARELDLPCASILERARATIAQYDLDRTDRAANVADAFRLLPPPPTFAHGSRPLAGRWPILVDDVVTTGATLAACAQVLLASGAVGVSAVTVARER